jgi:hypothetical protein
MLLVPTTLGKLLAIYITTVLPVVVVVVVVVWYSLAVVQKEK